MSATDSDRVKLAEFVRELYRYVGGVREVPDAWVETWTQRAIAINDPVAFFSAFVASKAIQDLQGKVTDVATRWPHGHFYSPVVSRKQLASDWPRLSKPRIPAAVDMRADAQAELFPLLAATFDSMPFGDAKIGELRYQYSNPSYGFGDACIYWGMLHVLRPRKIIEVGCGYTSALALDAIDILGLPTTCSFIDPYPDRVRKTTAPLGPMHEILPIRVQDLDPAKVEELGENDILFIDSTHVVKTGSDVHFELTELLPRLRPGVVVHFHDVFYPFEYIKPWALELNHSWNETYFLHTFLMYNTAFRIEYFNHFLVQTRPDLINRYAPHQAKRLLLNPGGGLWLRRS